MIIVGPLNKVQPLIDQYGVNYIKRLAKKSFRNILTNLIKANLHIR